MSVFTSGAKEPLAKSALRVGGWLAGIAAVAFVMWLLEDMRFLLWLSYFFF